MLVTTSLQPNLKPCFKPLTSFPSRNPNFFLLKSLTFSPQTSNFAKPIISLQVKAKPSVISDELPLDDSLSGSSSDKKVSFWFFFFSFPFLFFFRKNGFNWIDFLLSDKASQSLDFFLKVFFNPFLL